MKKLYPFQPLPFILFALAMLALAGCNGTVIAGLGADAAMYLTKPGAPPPADTEHQMAAHESWCYETLANPQCYATPQDVPPDRLINVDPPNRYPLNAHAYNEALAQAR